MLYVVLGLFFGGAGAWFMARYAFALGLVDIPNNRSSHYEPTPSGGGVGLLLAFVVTAFVAGAPVSLWLPATILSLVSFFDDRLELSSKLRLFFQFTSAAVVVFGFIFTEFSLLSLVLVPFWLIFVVGTANFYNFMDGVNGISGITGVVGFSLMALFAFMTHAESSLMLLSIALAAACAGFIPFNLPKARVFMGDVGSVLLGFVFACLVFYGSKNLSGFICLATFLFPFYADTLTTLYVRWRDGEQLSLAHRRHFYQVLCNEYGQPHWQVACGFGLTQLFIGGLMLFFYRLGLVWQVGLVVFVAFIFTAVSLRVRGLAVARVKSAHVETQTGQKG